MCAFFMPKPFVHFTCIFLRPGARYTRARMQSTASGGAAGSAAVSSKPGSTGEVESERLHPCVSHGPGHRVPKGVYQMMPTIHNHPQKMTTETIAGGSTIECPKIRRTKSQFFRGPPSDSIQ